MLRPKRLNRLRLIYNEYSSQFWVLVLGTFIDRLGGALMFPFFTLYITRKFGVGMTTVGVIFGLFSIASVIGSMFGGALTDRMGRKSMVIFGLVFSALTSILMGVVNTIEAFFIVTGAVGLLANVAGPAQQAMVADLLPEPKRAQGFGIIRVVANLSVTLGPMIGGLLITQSYLWLFIADAITSLITAVIVYAVLEETRPSTPEDMPEQTIGQTFAGYRDVLRDGAFLWFLGASALMVLVYMQMNSTLAVYLRDSHGVPEQWFGYILSLNAAMVVLFQFPLMRWIEKFRPMTMMVVGTLLYALGFGMYGFTTTYVMFLLAMVIITIGEMLVSPVGQALVAQFAPEAMRGRYMAVFGFSWVIPSAIGPLLAGLVMDNADPRWVWYGAGIIGVVAAAAFALLERWVGRSQWDTVSARLDVMDLLERGEITAVAAHQRLEAIKDGSWAAIAKSSAKSTERRYVRIRVSDALSGAMKYDLQLPLAVVNIVLTHGGRLSDDLAHLDLASLGEILAGGMGGQTVSKRDNGDDETVEVSVE
ncbi:MAG: MFS transporter [Ardenticatenaceae bacterium]|nr:MFS transporter [Ardenticatenaceae bacterium]MCB9446232.1 MFS transporter [Ardenticatenaceae bacterium]